jgi:nucleoside-diphosphate-sugar epimerase
MRILITGGAGYLGCRAAAELLRQGHEVRASDSLLHGGHSLLGLYPDRNFSFTRGDIRSANYVDGLFDGIDAVVHLAAIVGDPACARDPETTREVNLDSALRLFALSQQHGVERFIFSSTCSNYGKMADSSQYAFEDSELLPVSLYAETKVAVERAILDSTGTRGPSVTVLRFATLFGLSPRPRFDLTVNEFTMELLVRRKLEVYGEQFWRPYVHVCDAARAIALALASPLEKVADQVFNVGDTGQNYRKQDLIELICSQIETPLDVQYVRREEDPRDYRVSFEKIKRQLGFEITHTVEDGIKEIIDAINQGVINDFDDPRYRN